MALEDDIKEIVLSENEIQLYVQSLAQEIYNHYERRSNLLLIGVLRGCVTFLSDLIREIYLPLEIDFLAVESYGQSSQSSGVVRVLKDLNETIEDRHVLLVEDLIDTGHTLNYLMGYLRARKPATLGVCALMDKSARREIEVKLDFVGTKVPNEFLVGYGLDYAQKYRNLPYVASLKEHVIQD